MHSWPALLVSGVGIDAPADLVAAALLDFDVLAIVESGNGTWHVHFTSGDRRDAARDALPRLFPTLSLQPIDIEDEDWAARSQASLTHVRVREVIVAPPWDIPDVKAQGSRHKAQGTTVVIQPSMGFGTGHHATTRLCLAALQDIDLHGRTVLDVGTGSGVLAIAASLLGASAVAGIDDDADAIQAARENAALNVNARVAFDLVDLRVARAAPADIVLANLTGALLASAASTLQSLTSTPGTLILSGLMTSEEPEVLTAFASLNVIRRDQEDEWLCLTLRKP